MLKQEKIAEIFGENENITRDDFLKHAEKLGDLSTGEYIAKGKYESDITEAKKAGGAARQAELDEINSKLSEATTKLGSFADVDVEKYKKFPEEITALKKDHYVQLNLVKSKALDIPSVLPHIDKDKIVADDKGNFTGLDEQIEALKKDKSFLFDNAQPVGKASSATKSGKGEPTPDFDEEKARHMLGLKPTK